MEGDYFKPTEAWANAHGVAWGIAETGCSDKAAEIDPTWPTDTYNAAQEARWRGIHVLQHHPQQRRPRGA